MLTAERQSGKEEGGELEGCILVGGRTEMQSLRWGVSAGQKRGGYLSLLPLLSPPPPDHTKDLLRGPLHASRLLFVSSLTPRTRIQGQPPPGPRDHSLSSSNQAAS